MDEQKGNNMGNGQSGTGRGWCSWCGCSDGHGMHGHWHGGRFILRIVLAIIVVAIGFRSA